MNANGKDKTIEFDIKKEMTPVKFRYLKKGKGGRKHIVAIIANYKQNKQNRNATQKSETISNTDLTNNRRWTQVLVSSSCFLLDTRRATHIVILSYNANMKYTVLVVY